MKPLTDLAYQILGMLAVMIIVVAAVLIGGALLKRKILRMKWGRRSLNTYDIRVIHDNGDIPPYYKKQFLTEPEQTLFIRLMEALPINVILAQVSMQALIGIKRNRNEQGQRNGIAKKYVDFVICRPDFSVAAVIELDDPSHERPDRIEADTVKNIAFRAAGIPLIRFDVRAMPTVEEIRARMTMT